MQAATRNYLWEASRLRSLLELIGLSSIENLEFEALWEKALPQGYVDILLKEMQPSGVSRKVLVEVKLGMANSRDFTQLQSYIDELGRECLAGVLLAEGFPKHPPVQGISRVVYSLGELRESFSFEELVSALRFELVS